MGRDVCHRNNKPNNTRRVIMTKYQQGDVVITEITDAEEKQCNELIGDAHQDGPAVLAFGEATGHSHKLEPVPGVLVTTFTKKYQTEPEFFKVDGGGITLYHEEHNPITLPEGKYRVRIVRQFNHMTQRSERVWD